MPLKYKWIKPNSQITPHEKQLADDLQLPITLIKLMNNRGVKTERQINQFLVPNINLLQDPYRMHDMHKGINLIRRTIKSHKKITVYGDYDVDGITATSIMYSLLKQFHADVHYFIPNRFRDGYGPNLAEYKRIIANGTKLLITVDNGISGLKEITYARQHGMDVIITDHHDFPDKLPPANAIIMAKYPHHEYNPDPRGHSKEDYCGAGIAFKIAQAMLHRIPAEYLDIATLGTVADSVNLRSENRIIVANGMRMINTDHRPGIIALANIADIALSSLEATDLSFSLIPRLNALGRMRDGNIGVELLTTHDTSKAEQIAKVTEKENRDRQKYMRKETKEAMEQALLPDNEQRQTLVLANPNWFPGVVGIVASQVLNKVYKPTIVIGHLSSDDKKGIDRGSGRSIPEFNLFKAMNPLRRDMTSFGGHPMACGLSIYPRKIGQLRHDLERAGLRAHLDRVQPEIKPELEVSPNDITSETYAQLNYLAPFGVGNQQPLLDVKIPKINNIGLMGKANKHMWISFENRDAESIRAVGFHFGKLYTELHRNPYYIEIVGTLGINNYNGRHYLQLVIKHIRHYRIDRIECREIEPYIDIYKYLKKIGPLSLSAIHQTISQATGYSRLGVERVLKTFDELHFSGEFKNTNANYNSSLAPNQTYYYLRKNPPYHRLSESPSYQRYIGQID